MQRYLILTQEEVDFILDCIKYKTHNINPDSKTLTLIERLKDKRYDDYNIFRQN